VNLIGRKRAKLDKFFDFGDDVVGGGGHHGIEVARGLAIEEIAPAVALPRFDESKVAANAALENVVAAIEFARFFAVRDHGAEARWCEESGNAGAASADAFRESALRIQLEFELTVGDKLLEEFVFADVGGDHFLDLALFEQDADAEAVHAGVVGDDGEIFRTFALDGSNEIFGDAAKAKAAHEDGHAVFKIGDGSIGGSDALVHGLFLSSWRVRKLQPLGRQCTPGLREPGRRRADSRIAKGWGYPHPRCFCARVRKRLKEKELEENFILQECAKSAEDYENRGVRHCRMSVRRKS